MVSVVKVREWILSRGPGWLQWPFLLKRARRALAPDMGRLEYLRRVFRQKRHKARFPQRPFHPSHDGEQARREVQAVVCRYVGRENVRETDPRGTGALFVRGHFGCPLEGYFLARAFPRTQLFGRVRTFRGDRITHSLLDDPGVGLAKMIQYLRLGVPVCFAFDGKVGKQDLPATLLGLRRYFARGYPHLVRLLDPPVHPVLGTFRGPDRLDLYVGEPLFAPGEAPSLSDEAILARTISAFEKRIRETDPGQIDLHFLERVPQAPEPPVPLAHPGAAPLRHW